MPAYRARVRMAVGRSQVRQIKPQLGLITDRNHVVYFTASYTAGDAVAADVADGSVHGVDELAEFVPPETATAHRHGFIIAERTMFMTTEQITAALTALGFPLASGQAPVPACANCGCNLFAHERHGSSRCANRSCGCPGWQPAPRRTGSIVAMVAKSE